MRLLRFAGAGCLPRAHAVTSMRYLSQHLLHTGHAGDNLQGEGLRTFAVHEPRSDHQEHGLDQLLGQHRCAFPSCSVNSTAPQLPPTPVLLLLIRPGSRSSSLHDIAGRVNHVAVLRP